MGHDGTQDAPAAPNSADTRADDDRPILTVTEAAQLLRISRSFTYELVPPGAISHRYGSAAVS